jgi:Trk K+ transport system NAD-binding subunit
VLVVDTDPHALSLMQERGARTLYGDAEEPELIAELPLRGTSWVVSTVPSREVNLALVHGLQHAGYTGEVAATAHHDRDAERLEEAGVDVVLRPFHAAADNALTFLGEPRRRPTPDA